MDMRSSYDPNEHRLSGMNIRGEGRKMQLEVAEGQDSVLVEAII